MEQLTATPVVIEPNVLQNQMQVTLSPEQETLVADKIAKIDFVAMAPLEISTIGNEAEKNLSRILDAFLGKIGEFEDPKVFQLFTKLKTQMDKEDLPAIVDKIMNGKPSFLQTLRAGLTKKGLMSAKEKVWEQTKLLASGKTKSLADTMHVMESELASEQKNIVVELNTMEQLKAAYRDAFKEFVVAVAFLQRFYEKAHKDVEAYKATMDPNDPNASIKLKELENKLAQLESRGTAVMGTMVRLPSDHLVIQQLQNAGLSTLVETMSTAANRFSSIKMTLLSIHGAIMVGNLQRLDSMGAALDAQMLEARGKLMTDVVTQAANAPGDNRLAQVEQLKQIILQTKTLAEAESQGRAESKRKFAEARSYFSEAREELIKGGEVINLVK